MHGIDVIGCETSTSLAWKQTGRSSKQSHKNGWIIGIATSVALPVTEILW